MQNENFSLLFEDLERAQKKMSVVIVGRFQPPTAGHFKLINEAKKFIRENKDVIKAGAKKKHLGEDVDKLYYEKVKGLK